MRKTTVSGSFDDVLIVTGYVVEFEPEAPTKRDILRPVEPDEPDTEVEVGYSRNAIEPLTVVFRDKKVELTKSAFILFRYINDLYRAEGQEEFEFSQLSEVLAGNEFAKSKSAIESLVRRINVCLVKINAPITLNFYKETVYVVCQK